MFFVFACICQSSNHCIVTVFLRPRYRCDLYSIPEAINWARSKLFHCSLSVSCVRFKLVHAFIGVAPFPCRILAAVLFGTTIISFVPFAFVRRSEASVSSYTCSINAIAFVVVNVRGPRATRSNARTGQNRYRAFIFDYDKRGLVCRQVNLFVICFLALVLFYSTVCCMYFDSFYAFFYF